MSQITQEPPALDTRFAPIFPCVYVSGCLLPQPQDPARASQIKDSCALNKMMLFEKKKLCSLYHFFMQNI